MSPLLCPKLGRKGGPLAEGEWRSGEDSAQAVLLHVEAGVLDYLETYRHDGQVPKGLPPAAELTTWAG